MEPCWAATWVRVRCMNRNAPLANTRTITGLFMLLLLGPLITAPPSQAGPVSFGPGAQGNSRRPSAARWRF